MHKQECIYLHYMEEMLSNEKNVFNKHLNEKQSNIKR